MVQCVAVLDVAFAWWWWSLHALQGTVALWCNVRLLYVCVCVCTRACWADAGNVDYVPPCRALEWRLRGMTLWASMCSTGGK